MKCLEVWLCIHLQTTTTTTTTTTTRTTTTTTTTTLAPNTTIHKSIPEKTNCASVFACIFCNLRERGCLINASTGINIKEIPQFIGIGGFLSRPDVNYRAAGPTPVSTGRLRLSRSLKRRVFTLPGGPK